MKPQYVDSPQLAIPILPNLRIDRMKSEEVPSPHDQIRQIRWIQTSWENGRSSSGSSPCLRDFPTHEPC